MIFACQQDALASQNRVVRYMQRLVRRDIEGVQLWVATIASYALQYTIHTHIKTAFATQDCRLEQGSRTHKLVQRVRSGP